MQTTLVIEDGGNFINVANGGKNNNLCAKTNLIALLLHNVIHGHDFGKLPENEKEKVTNQQGCIMKAHWMQSII